MGRPLWLGERVRDLMVDGHELGRPFISSFRQTVLWNKAGHDSENQIHLKYLALVDSRDRGHEVASRPEEVT